MTVRVFFHNSLKETLPQLGLDPNTLKEDFKRFKETGVPASNLGRDAEYNHPNGLPIVRQERLSHIHLEEPSKPWNVRAVQFSKTSDTHLVYCQGFYDQNCYLLMAILSPNAHEQARNNSIMYNLGKMAEKFRNQY